MKWQMFESPEARDARISEWHPYFTWFPRCFYESGKDKYTWVWLETIQRRWDSTVPYDYRDWEYKL